MTPEDLTEAISFIVSEVLGIDEVDLTPDADFTLDLNATPIDMQKLQERLEEQFDISLPSLVETKNLTVAELSALVEDSIL